MDRIRLREKRFHERAYLFVLQALEYCQAQLVERRHITGRELAEACRDLALARYGVMARLVLEHWGLRSSGDIGTVVFPDAELKIFLTASAEERAQRRRLQLQAAGIEADGHQLLKDIQERDLRDSSRAVAPLKPAADAIVLDSTDMPVNEVAEKIKALLRSALNARQ